MGNEKNGESYIFINSFYVKFKTIIEKKNKAFFMGYKW